MTRLRAVLVLFSAMLSMLTPVFAQPPLPFGNQSSSRSADDQIEGSVWEYKGTLKKKTSDSEPQTIEGKFRLEDEAIFDVSSRFKIPSRKVIKEEVVDPLIAGEGIELKLPEGPQQKRLGEFHKISNSRIRLNFDDKDSLHGIMIMVRKKKTSTVWIGTYKEQKNKRTVREYKVVLKQIED